MTYKELSEQYRTSRQQYLALADTTTTEAKALYQRTLNALTELLRIDQALPRRSRPTGNYESTNILYL